MKRIGLAASKISQGNIWLYHVLVILISSFFSVFLFLVCGFLIALAIFLLSLMLVHLLPSVNQQAWLDVFRVCLTILGILIGLLTVAVILKNVKLKSKL